MRVPDLLFRFLCVKRTFSLILLKEKHMILSRVGARMGLLRDQSGIMITIDARKKSKDAIIL